MSVRHHFLIGALLISCGITPARERPDDDGIPTLPELNQKFAQADRLAANGRFDLVAKLYQSSLKSAHGKLITQPAWETPTDERVYIRYRPAREAIERQLAKLPPEGLAAYRLLADGDAEAVLSRLGPAKREEALGIIASQHFLSSLGDNASLELAGLHLDRFEFEPAIRHLRRVLDLYPDPSINLGFARLRLAAALTLSGKETALSTLLEKTPPPEHLLKPIRAIAARTTATGPNAVEPTPAPQVPIDVGNLRPAWNHPFTLRQPPHWPVGFLEHLPIEQEDEDLEELREEHRWFPTTRLLSTPGALLFKTNERLVCCDPATGTLRWLGFRNHFVLDGVSGVYRLWSRVSWTRDMLLNPEEAQLFGDHVMSQFSLLPSGHVANLEGPHVTGENLPKKKGARPNIDWFGGPQAAVDTRARPNQLMVYRVQDGLVTLRFDAEEFAESDSACFMAAPIAHADTLILPLLDEKKLSLLGITVDFATHRYELRWRTFLTAETLDAVARFAAVGLAHSPNGITVASGNGVIHQIDPASGAVRWAFTYPRSIRENSQVPHRFDPYKKMDGWETDHVATTRHGLLVLPSDLNAALLLDPTTGTLNWAIDRDKHTYLVGIHGDEAVLAGPDRVTGINLRDGKTNWEQTDTPLTGRATLNDSTVYLPADESILAIDTTQRPVKPTHFELDLLSPLGNLHITPDGIATVGTRNVLHFSEKPEASFKQGAPAP